MTVLRTQLAGITRRPARLLLTGLALIVAATVVFGTVLARDITTETILDTFSGTSKAADIVVGSQTGASADVLAVILETPGVAAATSREDRYFAVPSASGGPLRIAVDPGSGPLAEVTLTSGTYPAAANQIAVTPRTAERMGLRVGGTVDVRSDPDAPLHTLTVTGIVTPARGEGFAGTAYTGAAVLASLIGPDTLSEAKASRIEVHLAPGAGPETIVQELQRTLPLVPMALPPNSVRGPGAEPEARAPEVKPDVVLGPGLRRQEALEAAGSLDDFFYLIGLFVAIASAAAALVATATFRIVFAQRMRQIALLRAIGAGRGPLTRALAAEGALTGLVAGIAGVCIAYLLGLGVGPIFGLFSDSTIAVPGLPLLPAVLVIAGTTVVAVIAVLSPAVNAGRTSPLEALRAASVTGVQNSLGPVRWTCGLLTTAGSVALVAVAVFSLPGPDGSDAGGQLTMLATVASGVLAFVSLMVLGPVVLRPVLWLVGLPLRVFGPTGRLAVGGVGGAPKRASSVSVIVALAVTLTVPALIGISYAQVKMDQELALLAPADLRVTATDGTAIPDGAVNAADANPALRDVVPYRLIQTRFPVKNPGGVTDDVEVPVADLTLSSLRTGKDLRVLQGSLDAAGPGNAIALAGTDDVLGGGYGEQVTITRGGRTVTVTVVATMSELPSRSTLLLDPSDLTGLGVPAEPTVLLLDAAGDRDAAVEAAQSLVPGGGVEVLADQRDSYTEELLLVTVSALGLVGMTVVVAVVGVGTTTALSVVERLREAGLLRAVGMSRGRLRATLLLEASLYGVVGSLLGLALAIPFAWLIMSALGLDAPLTGLPWGQLALVVLILGLLTAASGVLPARRASRISPTAALAMD